MDDAIIFRARKIITMDRVRPVATHVAVRQGKIVAVGSKEEAEHFGPGRHDDRFADKVLLPGFVEGHVHMDGATIWRMTYIGSYDRIDPDGRVWTGVATIEEAIARLCEHPNIGADGVVMGWGFDPLLMGARLERKDLDRVSAEQPVVVLHASGHILACNSRALRQASLFPARASHPGLPLGADGSPMGEVRGVELMGPAARALDILKFLADLDASGAQGFSRMAVRTGVTTATDLNTPLGRAAVEGLLRATGAEDFPLRIVPALFHPSAQPDDLIARARALSERSTERLRLGAVKMVLDGSIQGFTARLLAGAYYNHEPNGLWYMSPERLQGVYEAALAGGVQVHTHTNGDQATELALDCLERALERGPARDHRFMLQHAQLASRAQFERGAALGVGFNLFVNHLYYWGEAHRAHTVGPERADTMNAARSALEAGAPLALHSDDPVTPMSPLFTAWCAVNRLTASGRTLGEKERIDVEQALHAITLGAAWTLKLDHEIGSIAPGKRADFAVLEDDPLQVDPGALRDIKVWGTVSGGRIFEAARL